jgi:signal transduction histidine kinase
VTAETAIDRVDVSAVVSRVVAARHTLARVVGVQLETSGVDAGVALAADEALVERAVAVLVDNAILHCRKGDRVRVGLRGFERGTRLSLTVSDTGPGVDDAVFAALTANRRFRGDESRARRPDGRGLGLAVAREVADRFGLKLDLRRPASGGFEAEIATR